MNVRNQVIEHIETHFPRTVIGENDFDLPYQDFGLDSLDVFELAMDLEQTFDIAIDDSIIEESKTINGLIENVEKIVGNDE